jgi:arginyl-tRNA synthetase
MSLETQIAKHVQSAIAELYKIDVNIQQIPLQQTRVDLEGDYTLVVFGFTRFSAKKPEETAQEIGEKILSSIPEVGSFNVVKGFLNLVISDKYYQKALIDIVERPDFGFKKIDEHDTVVLEYSSPNTNKPLHLGHIRNNLLGWSIAEILKANGKNVKKVNLINDRGIHICKSILAWQKWGLGETPSSSEKKGDKLVGEYYVLFDKKYKQQIKHLIEQGIEEEKAKKEAPLMVEAQKMLKRWEKGDAEVIDVWREMNGWVYEGFNQTYTRMGIDFEKFYYESDTYKLGKYIVNEGLKKGVFFKKEDGSVWCDLSDEGMDEKLLLRADGTSVYITQDLGTAQLRVDEFNPSELLYVVGNEQNYHFDVLKIILKKLGKDWANNIKHISYGMVELPDGKMKSREGTVVDADDLMDKMFVTAKETTEKLGKLEDFDKDQAKDLYTKISLGALKYFILKVDPKKQMLFNPSDSIDFDGNTGPFIQYTYARIQSLLRKAGNFKALHVDDVQSLNYLEDKEKQIIKQLINFPSVIQQAASKYSPGILANYLYELVKSYNQFYQKIHILSEKNAMLKAFRLQLSQEVGIVISKCTGLLGIQVPERM